MSDLQEISNLSEMTVRTKPGAYYIPPKPHEVVRLMQANGLSLQNWDLLADVVNLLSDGGQFTTQEHDLYEADEWAGNHLQSQASRGKYLLKSTDGNQTTTDVGEARADATKVRVTYHQNCREFLTALCDSGALYEAFGSSPLQKAISLIKMLSQQNVQNQLAGMMGMLARKGFKPIAVAERIKEAIRTTRSLTEEERALMAGGGGGGTLSPELVAAQIATDMLTGKDMILKVARHLSSLSKMTIGRSVERRVDPEGTVLDPRGIDDWNEFPRLSGIEHAYPRDYQLYRIATRQARVYLPAKEVAKKQCIYMIVDCSGSMMGDKTYIAGGCVMRALKGVIAEDAEVYIRYFDTQLKEEMRARTRREAQDVMKLVLAGNQSGGGTQIANCALDAVHRIRSLVEEDGLARPELVIVTDGEDNTTGLTEDDFAGIKLHTIVIHCESGRQDYLLDLSRRTGGVGINIPHGMF